MSGRQDTDEGRRRDSTAAIDGFMQGLDGPLAKDGTRMPPRPGVKGPTPAPVMVDRDDWPGGLDSAHANARNISLWLQQVFRERQNREPPADLIKQFDAMALRATGEQPREPEYGPGRWASMPQRTADMVVMARPLDLTGAPSRIEVDLMMLHAIRMGERLCRVYPDWAQSLPWCWIRHDYIIEETFALACYQDLICAGASGGFYAPVMQQYIQQALSRIKEQMALDNASKADHRHHMDDPEALAMRARRQAEYERWADNKDPWNGEKGKGWRGGHGFATVMTDFRQWPPRPAEPWRPDDVNLGKEASDADSAFATIDGRLDELRATRTGRLSDGTDRPQLVKEAEAKTELLEGRFNEWLRAERTAHIDLDRTVAAARRAHPDLDRHTDGRLAGLITEAERLLKDAGDPDYADEYHPQRIADQMRLRVEIDRLSQGDADPTAHGRGILARIRTILGATRKEG
ncbi:hypothetical protein COO72_05140 [Bifidobacterium callitrichos]|nr:hypothetical protein COO72_05140 [Bifidobacterium callitrichos]